MMKEECVTITLEEYKELLLKERPNDNDKWLLGKIKDFIASECVLDDDYQSIQISSSYSFAEHIMDFLKLIDKEFYKQIVKKCYDDKLEEEETRLRKEKMKALKELDKESEE